MSDNDFNPETNLTGLIGLEQLERSALSTWMIGVSVTVGLVLIAFGLNLFLLRFDGFHENLIIGNTLLFMLFFGAFPGFAVFILVHLSRGLRHDIGFLKEYDPMLDRCMDSQRLNNRLTRVIVLGTVIFMLFATGTVSMRVKGYSFEQQISKILTDLDDSLLFVFLSFLGALAGVTMALYVKQYATLVRLASHITINLVSLDACAAISGQAIRYTSIVVFFICLCSLLPVAGPVLSEQVPVMLGLLLTIVMPILLLYLYPVYLLRNRIYQYKQAALDAIRSRIMGDSSVELPIELPSGEMSPGDLVSLQMFVESRWEWPIAAHMQKLFLFGLLPPLTWVLAATIENILY